MSMIDHYRSNMRDQLFNLFELWKIQENILGKSLYESLDEETVKDVLVNFDKFCKEKISITYSESDRKGLSVDNEGNVFLPDCLRKCMDEYYEMEWNKLDYSLELEGFGIPRSVFWTSFETIAGANSAMCFYLLGNFVAGMINDQATQKQKELIIPGLTKRKWGATMVLTEPDAGSDVGAARSKAKHIENDIWEIEGTKRFITNGDYDTENIIHMVLARPEGAANGTKGLSLFLVPKFWINEDGSIGDRNGIYVTKVEDKMGLKASSTCELTMGGDKGNCRGWLMGDTHNGIKQMFQCIEYARMAVGVKSMSTLSTAYLNSLKYTKERIQGSDLSEMMNKEAPRVAIINHPDVRRSLMRQKAYSESLRSLSMMAAVLQDQIEIAKANGEKDKLSLLERKNDLLLPLIKGFSSERVYEVLAESLQCLGGSGYCKDYPHEQYIRDQKIDTLYEGTTAIQGLDLIFRKIMKDKGEALNDILKDALITIKTSEGGDSLSLEREQLSKALNDLNIMMEVMMKKMEESVYHVGLHSSRLLYSLTEVLLGWLLIKQAAIAISKLSEASEEDIHFYNGKIACAKYFAHEELPRVSMSRRVIEKSNLTLMELPEDSF
jgi:alkylation response protein AidB-like acyl-CoA dehydrogenase